jgi:hypothetical protein
VAVAVNCSPYPWATAIEDGDTAIEVSAAWPTVRVVELEMEFKVAEIVAMPWPELEASP